MGHTSLYEMLLGVIQFEVDKVRPSNSTFAKRNLHSHFLVYNCRFDIFVYEPFNS